MQADSLDRWNGYAQPNPRCPMSDPLVLDHASLTIASLVAIGFVHEHPGTGA